MQRKQRAGKSGAITRKQATQIALLAFVAADCAGIYYAQQRLDRHSQDAALFAYQTPGAPAEGAVPSFTPSAAPSLALAAPAAATPVAAAPAAAMPARAAVRAAAPASAPLLAAATPAAGDAALVTIPPRAERRAAALAAAARASIAPEPALAMHRHAAAKATAFDNAFSLADEAPEAELRFGQGADSAGTGGLADLVAPRAEPVPLFDKAGIAPVTGQAATVDAPAADLAPAPAAAAELPATNG
jgi:ribonuclease E